MAIHANDGLAGFIRAGEPYEPTSATGRVTPGIGAKSPQGIVEKDG